MSARDWTRSASGTDPALVAAAIRIQAAERGRQARKRARKMAAEFFAAEPAVAILAPAHSASVDAASSALVFQAPEGPEESEAGFFTEDGPVMLKGA